MTNDIIVLIPGIGGSRLERDGKPIYDLSLAALPRIIWNWADDNLIFRCGSKKPDDGVVATALFNNQLIPGYFGIDDYDGLCAALQSVVADPTRQLIKFPYDWRASNRWAAEALDEIIRPKLHDWRNGSGGADAMLWLVCHSMGGLVARYFLESLGGAEITRHLVTIGTPHRGAPKALNALVNGLGLGSLDFSEVIRSFASTYELLPQYPVIRLGEGSQAPLARVEDFFSSSRDLPESGNDLATQSPSSAIAPLPNMDPQRFRDARQFHATIRAPVQKRISTGTPTPYRISCLLNRRQPTPQQALWTDGALRMLDTPLHTVNSTEDWRFLQGDGTVPGPSAIPIEWPNSAEALSVSEMHVAMPSSRVAIDLIYNLANPLETRAYMSGGVPEDTIGLKVPPIVGSGDQFEIMIDVIKSTHLTVSTNAVGAIPLTIQHSVRLGERSCARLPLCLKQPGCYRISVKSVDPMRVPVSDWVVVINSQ